MAQFTLRSGIICSSRRILSSINYLLRMSGFEQNQKDNHRYLWSIYYWDLQNRLLQILNVVIFSSKSIFFAFRIQNMHEVPVRVNLIFH